MNDTGRGGAAGTGISAELLGALATATLSPDPWPHVYLPRTLSAGTAHRLAAEFPAASLRRAHRPTGEKTYRLRTRSMDPTTGQGVAAHHELALVLQSIDYRAALERLTGVDLAGSSVELGLWEYSGGDWLAPHVDKPDKVVTQIFYLSTAWSPPHAGRLLVFDGVDGPREVAAVYPPVAGSSVVLVRSATSWHAVEAPSPGSPPRRSVTAMFRRPSAGGAGRSTA